MTKAAKQLIENVDDICYEIIGENECMGDHKVIKLSHLIHIFLL
jgi:hypothetical protein